MPFSFRHFFSYFILVPALLYLFSFSGYGQQVTGERLGTDSKTDTVQRNVIVNAIGIIGNKVTKKHIILRELSFAEGDTIVRALLPKKLSSSRENLLNTSLFNFVTIDTIPLSDDRINVLITVAERWYTWPIPIFEVQERNFNTWWETKDLERANYGFYLERENFRGRKEDLSFYFQFGYTEKYGITYKVPYLNKKRNSGAGISFSYARNHEVTYGSVDNEQLFFKDPTQYVREEFSGKLNGVYRSGIYNTHTLEVKYVSGRVNDTLLDYTVDYFTGNKTQTQFMMLDYFFRMDHRDAKFFPLNGYLVEVEATKIGFNLLHEEETDVLNLFLTLRKYHKLSNRFYLAGSTRIKYSPTKDQPYYVQRGLGWGDYVRGYEYYVMDGQSYGLAKLGLKYQIIKPKVRSIPIPLEKFNTFHYALYAGIFGDAGYADDHQYAGVNPLSNTMLYGYGAGMYFVTYYDIIFRFEYSFNRKLEHGFFVSFNAGI